MVGQPSGAGRADRKPVGAVASGAAERPRLDVRNLTVGDRCVNITFSIRAGERVGLAGLSGSGKAEVADSIVGMIDPDGGSILVDGKPLRLGSVHRAIKGGIGYVPQDRHARGLSPNLAVDENLTMTAHDRLGPVGIVDPRARAVHAGRLIDSLSIVTAGPKQCVAELSGGNQQKTVMGRALATDPQALVLQNPTAGVDIASKEALYATIQAIPDVAVLLVSDELDELAICDRVLVMFDGRIVREFGSDWEDSELVGAMEGVEQH
jgi:simple sugar transport system ATP-binding protein